MNFNQHVRWGTIASMRRALHLMTLILLCASLCAAAEGKKGVGNEPADAAEAKQKQAARDAVVDEERHYMVVDAFGAPIPNAALVLSIKTAPWPVRKDAPGNEALQTVNGESNDRGGMTLSHLAGNNVVGTARVHHRDYGTARCEVDISRRQHTLRFPLVRSGTEAHKRAVRGQVVTSDGKAIAGAVVHCGSVRTPGMGLVNPLFPLGDGLTDDEGRFTLYLPNGKRDDDRGDLIPLNSRYWLTVSGPEGDAYFPVSGYYSNTEAARIELPLPTRLHRLRFEAPGGGWLEEPEQLRQVYVRYAGEGNGERTFVELDSLSLFRGRRLLPGTYQAVCYRNGTEIRYHPLIVTLDSPAQLVLQLPPPATFVGRVVHGVTGKPMAGAMIMAWKASVRNNLALLTADDWKLLHELPASPELDAPAIERLGKIYGVQRLVRTDDQGRFEITRTRDQVFYGLMAFDEDFIPLQVRLDSLPSGGKERVEAGEFPLFPAAKVLVRPVFDGQNLGVYPKWVPDPAGQPDWFDRFRTVRTGADRQFEQVYWLKLNEMQPIHVPAGVRLRLRLETPYADEWAPERVEKSLQLEQGAVVEIGDLHFAASLPATVRVVDGKGNPVEGAPVRRMYSDGDEQIWSIPHNTDKEGLAHFHVHPDSKGKFDVTDLPGPRGAGKPDNLATDFAVGRQAPEKRFEIILTEEQIRQLRGEEKSRPRNGDVE